MTKCFFIIILIDHNLNVFQNNEKCHSDDDSI